MSEWEPHSPHGPLRVTETSCCGECEWCSEGGKFLILRFNGKHYEETARGRYSDARPVWEGLVRHHHRCKQEP